MFKSLTATLAACLALVMGAEALAAISYTTAGALYTENFDGFPLDAPNGANIETVYTDGWQDDVDYTTSPQSDVSALGWHLHHPISPASENGVSGNQRFRIGQGANTGAFWGFATPNAADPDKALGSIGSTTVAGNGANMYMGLQLINNTGQTLNQFTLTYNGEQWRDGQSTLGETLTFDYSLSATDATWFDPLTSFTLAPLLNFNAVVTSGAGSSGNFVNGNVEGRVNNISTTVSGITWANGTELWLRWADPQLASNADDGLAVDDVRFSANVGGGNPNDITSVASGLASAAGTWSNNQVPSIDKTYRVVSPHTVTVDGPFAPSELRANSGGTINFDAGGNGAYVPLIIIDAGGNLTETAPAGDFALGNITAPTLGILQLGANVAFNIDASSDFFLDMALTGGGNMDFNSAAGSSLWLTATQNHQGVIRFNGTGDRVMITESQGIGNLEMNSTGANTVFYDPRVQADMGTLTFNQPGIIDHASVSVTPQRRLHGVENLVANAAITVDLTKGFPDNSTQAEERRYLVADSISGAANITVNGTAANYTAGATTLNEFELGSTPQPPSVLTNTFSGTITGNDFVNIEIRQRMPDARFVVNSNTRLEMGAQIVAPDAAKNIHIGEVVVNSGGILEVGFEQGPVAGSAFFEGTGHHVHHLNLTASGTRAGSLTLNDGATLRMQINGAAADQFDSISADGGVALNGTLQILINPPSTQASPNDNPIHTFEVNQTFNIITATAGALATDFDNSGAVNGVDFGIWKGAFGTGPAGDADDDNDSDGVDFLAWQRDFGGTGTGGITGTFDAVSIVDPSGAMSGKTFQVIVSASLVQLKVVSAVSAVPEPAGAALAVVALLLPAIRRRYNQA